MNFFKRFPSVSILIAGTLWGLTGIFVRILNSAGFDNFHLLFIRSAVTALVMVTYLFISDKSSLKINIKDWWYFFGTGVLSFFLFGFCYFYTISHASMSVAAILLYTAPFFVMIMAALFFREKITAVKVIALITAAAGCFMICDTDSNVKLTPFIIFTGISSGFCYALYSIFGRVALKKYSSSTVTAYTFIFAAAASALVTDFGSLAKASAAGPSYFALAIFFAVISAVLPYIFYTNGLKYTEPGKASIMATIEAVVASVSGIIAFRERITLVGIIGILLVLFAITAINVKKK